MSLRGILQERVSIAEMVGHFGVSLASFGNDYIGNCPLHDSAGPCLIVRPERGTYECLSCGANGDVLDFLTNIVGFGIGDAQAWLTEQFNIPIKQLRDIEIFVTPLLKGLTRRTLLEQPKNEVYKTLIGIAKCEISKTAKSDLLTKIKMQTGIPLGKLRPLMKKAKEEVSRAKELAWSNRYNDWEERNDRLMRQRERRRWKRIEQETRLQEERKKLEGQQKIQLQSGAQWDQARSIDRGVDE